MKKKMLVCDWYGLGIHPYTITTSRAKHPVHMIEGGDYITEDMGETRPECDMGVFGLNAKDYEIFKNNLVEEEIEIVNN